MSLRMIPSNSQGTMAISQPQYATAAAGCEITLAPFGMAFFQRESVLNSAT